MSGLKKFIFAKLFLSLLLPLTLLFTLNEQAFAKSQRDVHWGSGWADQDKDCQDTRAEVLIKETKNRLKFKRVGGVFDQATANEGNRASAGKICRVTAGLWHDPYSGRTFTKASDLDIDHIVPLNHAWQTGAKNWDMKRRRQFYNDLDNLVAVSLNENRSKGDRAPSEYLPSNVKFRCQYLQRWEFIKKKWSLKVPRSEAQYMTELKATYCRGNNH